MIWIVSIVVWVTLTAGVYAILSRDILRTVIGMAILGSGVNLLLFVTGRLSSPLPPIVQTEELVLRDAANPLPQALVLTAIVISFALLCFALVLALRIIRDADTDDIQELRYAEPKQTDSMMPSYYEPETMQDRKASGHSSEGNKV